MNQRGKQAPERDPYAFLAGGGEMGERTRAFDWSKTPVGPVTGWPQSLKIVIRIMLDSRYAMWLGWGPDYTFFYNDAYAEMTLGPKHPWALGRSAREVWREIWKDIGPRAESVVRTGQATWDEGLLLFLERRGFPEETYHTFSYSPVPNDQGGIGGMLCVVTEDTERTLGERRLHTLRELAARTTEQAKSVEDACQVAAMTLAQNPYDLPFVLIYLLDASATIARLAGAAGLAQGSLAAPRQIDLAAPESQPGWPLREVLESGRAEVVPELGERFGRLPGSAWPEPPQQALVLPLSKPGQARYAGFLVAAASPRLLLNNSYRGFFDLLAGHVATAVTNAGAYEEERRRAEALAELDRAKTAFFTNISHEFRTPLTLILSPLEDALTDTREPKQRDRLELIQRSALRLQKLANTLLDFSRIEAGRVQVSFEPTNLAVVTAELASVFRSAIEKAGLRLIVSCPPLSEEVYVDRDMYEKVVLNLLSNAFKFTLEGEIEVQLREAADAVEMSVRDTGSGISAEQLPHIFERFHRIEGVRARTHEGTGIGLALVHELVKLHKGTVRVQSFEGKGSIFTVVLPRGKSHLPPDRIGAARCLASTALAAEHYVEEARRWLPKRAERVNERVDLEAYPKSLATQHTTLKAPGRQRIVWADDNADMQEYVSHLLRPLYDVEAVPDGEAALTAILRELPNLVLADVMMPRLDGFALLRALRADERTRGLPVIMLSARAGEEARIEGMQAGADDYLIKPFSARELLARIGAHLEMARVRGETEKTLRESEARFRNMADNAPVMIWVADTHAACTYLNRAWYEFTGQTPETGLGFGWSKALHPDDREYARETFAAAHSERKPFRAEYRVRHRDGDYRWAIDSAAPRFGPDGRFLGYIGSVIDITDRKRAEKALQEADRRKNEFLAMLAHELRNPLAPIRNALGILRLAEGNVETIDSATEMMDRQIAQMVRLIDDLLDVSRISRGKVELRRGFIDLASSVRHAVESVRPLCESKGLQLSVKLPQEPVYLNADPIRLSQVVANLLSNACKFTDRGGQIWLTAEKVKGTNWQDKSEEKKEHDHGAKTSSAPPDLSAKIQPPEVSPLATPHLVLRVRDTGIGIAADQLPLIFEMFAQVDTSLERTRTGLGIGLTLAKTLVELHDGELEGHSAGLGHGSEFVVRLPLASSVMDDEPDAAAIRKKVSDSLATQHSPLAACNKRRILIVDDSLDSAESLTVLLDRAGNETRTAYDGVEALEAASSFRPDVILLDIGLPELNGYDVARKIREQPWGKDIVLVALTGWGQEGDRLRSQEAGINHHFTKPVDPAALKELLAATTPQSQDILEK